MKKTVLLTVLSSILLAACGGGVTPVLQTDTAASTIVAERAWWPTPTAILPTPTRLPPIATPTLAPPASEGDAERGYHQGIFDWCLAREGENYGFWIQRAGASEKYESPDALIANYCNAIVREARTGNWYGRPSRGFVWPPVAQQASVSPTPTQPARPPHDVPQQ